MLQAVNTFWEDLAREIDPHGTLQAGDYVPVVETKRPDGYIDLELRSPYGGTPLEFSLQPKQAIAWESDADEILFGGAAGGGKALALDTPIPTPSGWTTMGQVQVGDVVFDDKGHRCSVVGTSSVMHNRPCYKVTFSDGQEIIADAEHEWLTFDFKEREALRRRTPEFRAKRRKRRPRRGTGKRPDLAERNKRERTPCKPPPSGNVRTTEMIRQTLKHKGRTSHGIRMAPGIDCPARNLPIDPYVLGAWLGDGTAVHGAITTADPGVLRIISSRGYDVTDRKAKYSYGVLGLMAELRDLGVLGNKHIPQEYLRSSRDQRLELLRGLMDTDGHANDKGGCEFYSTNRVLANQFLELAISLGFQAHFRTGRAKLNGEDFGPKYTVAFTTSTPSFHLNRKRERQVTKERGTQDWRMIVSVQRVDSVPVRCIEVDSPTNLFLAGAGMIPTHNSFFLRILSIAYCVLVPGVQVYLFRRLSPDLQKNHMEGPTSYPELLAPWTSGGQAQILHSGAGVIKIGSSRIHLSHLQRESSLNKYYGPEMHVLLVDELTTFTSKMYKFLRGRVRLSGLDVPDGVVLPRIVAASNPGGIGHNFVKSMFVDPAPPFEIHRVETSEGGMRRQFIPALLEDNPALHKIDPDYENRLEGLGHADLVQALRYGSWDIEAGGMFDDLFDRDIHVIEPFEIPSSWYIDRSFDWGSTRPFSTGWWAESDGTEATLRDGSKRKWPKGTLFRIQEDYGWNGNENEGLKLVSSEIARRIIEREDNFPWGKRVRPGPADPSIYTRTDGRCTADDMEQVGVRWVEGDASPGSRKTGAEALRTRLKAAIPPDDARPGWMPEDPAIYIFSHCRQWIRTVPTLPRDEKDDEKVSKNSEDHIFDETKYRCLHKRMVTSASYLR